MNELSGHIILLSGHPGSGKTTLAETLAHLPGIPKVHLHSDDFWGYMKTGKIDPWLPEADAQNHMVRDIVASVAAHYARNDYMVIVDGVIRPWWLPAFTALGRPLHYIVLRTSVVEAVARCKARGGDSLTDPVVVSDLHAQFADLGAYERYCLSVQGLDRQHALALLVNALGAGSHRLAEQ